MSKHRIIFMGTPEFAVASLNALVDSGFDVAAVVTAPDRPAGRGRQLRASAVKEYAMAHGLPVLQPERLRDPEFLSALDALHASLYIVVAFRMLPEVVWSKPELGTINLHGSLLPDYRGAAPINWAIMNGEHTTGVTTFYIRQQIDTGDIIAQEQIAIAPEENAGELHDRMKDIGAALVVRTATAIFAGTAERKAQHTTPGTEPKEAPKLSPTNCRMDWSRGTQQVHDHIRGLSPYPGAWTMLVPASGPPVHFKVLAARITKDRSKGHPGSMHISKDQLFVHCADGSLELLEVQAEGKRRMSAAEYLRGNSGLEHAVLQ